MNKLDLIIDALELAIEDSFLSVNSVYRQALAAARELKSLAQPEQAVVPFPSFMRQRIEEAMDLAINPKGMSVHDGKAKVLVSDLHRMLLVIDSASPPKREWVGLSVNEARDFFESKLTRSELITEISEFLEEKNNG